MPTRRFSGVVGARAGHQPVADVHRPRVGGLKTGDQAQRGGFAATAGTEQTEDLAARQPEIDVGHRRDVPEVFPQARQAESIASDYLNVPPGQSHLKFTGPLRRKPESKGRSEDNDLETADFRTGYRLSPV